VVNAPTKHAIAKLVRSVLSSPFEFAPTQLLGGHRITVIPSDIERSDETTGAIWIVGSTWENYYECLARLSSEPLLEHLDRAEVDDFLWKLVADVFLHRRFYQEKEAQDQRITAFFSAVEKPHVRYEVMFPIERLTITGRSLDIGGATIFHLNQDEARTWGIVDERSQRHLSDAFINRTVGIVRVTSGSPEKAIEKAALLLDDALDALRVSLQAIPLATVRNDELLQSRGQFALAKVAGAEFPALERWERGFESLDLTLSERVLTDISDVVERINTAFSGQHPRQLSEAIRRAVGWIGASTAEERYDNRVIGLCTALECLLTTIEDKRKGEAIALRTMLVASAVEEGFTHPAEVYQLYDLRSKVVHGSARGICGESDYATLRFVTVRTFVNILRFIDQSSTPLKNASDLISSLETEARMSQSVTWLSGQHDRVSKVIRRFAEDRLVRGQRS